ncbi:hypothetical protein ABZX53_01575, partial [Streptomyces sp. NPDC004546]
PPEGEPAPSTARLLTAAADPENPLTAARIPTRGQTRRPHDTTGNRPDPEGEADVITVDCGTVGRRVLLVVPPEGEPAPSTARLLTAAADPENPLTAARIPTLGQAWRPDGTTGNPR